MVKRFRVVTIALLGANNVMKKHGEIVTKEDLTGSIDELLTEGFIEEVKETSADKKAEAERLEKEQADKDAADARAKEEAQKIEADKKAEAERLEKEQADKDAADAKAKEGDKKETPASNPLVDKLKNNK
ncbi:hypothetical protein [Pedobacter ureilyticus]|uniref:Uncharacterized protein n=1 Tax=Pedobacter ureilyticus TaxID=1393051 RepID=A0ABW9J5F7_9SPHI|nr:hypothetical protein [Pedobacter helvus]